MYRSVCYSIVLSFMVINGDLLADAQINRLKKIVLQKGKIADKDVMFLQTTTVDLNKNLDDETEFYPLVEAKRPEVVQKLLEKGADPLLVVDEDQGWTPIHYIVFKGEGDKLKRVFDYLIKNNKFDAINVPDALGRTPLMITQDLFSAQGAKKALEIIDILSLYNPNFSLRDKQGNTVLQRYEQLLKKGSHKKEIQAVIERLQKYINMPQEVRKAAKNPINNPVTDASLQKLTEQEKKEAVILPNEPGIRSIIADFLLDDEEQDKENKQEHN